MASTEEDTYKDMWQVFINWDKKYTDIDAFLNNLKYDLNVCLRIKLGLKVTDVNPYRLKKYSESIGNISENKLMTMLDLLLKIQEKTSGVWDYNSLFSNCILKLKNT